MGLLYAHSLDTIDPLKVARSFAQFGRQFAQDRDKLPQTDADRAFHLVAKATSLIDYQLPFADDVTAQKLIDQAHSTLEEALKLDPRNPDALRMERASQIPSFEGYYDFLREGKDAARAACMERAEMAGATYDGARKGLAHFLAMAPYLRWLAALAAKAIVCGHNHAALEYCDELLGLDPSDQADACFSAAIAYAKLEDEQGLKDLLVRTKSPCAKASDARNAWLLLAFCALAYKRCDFDEASLLVDRLCQNYPHAAITLYMQKELPDGVFARLAVPPFSEDELILAVSEGTVLLQEGRDASARGSFGAWMLHQADKRLTTRERLQLHDYMAQEMEQGNGIPGSRPNGASGPGEDENGTLPSGGQN